MVAKRKKGNLGLIGWFVVGGLVLFGGGIYLGATKLRDNQPKSFNTHYFAAQSTIESKKTGMTLNNTICVNGGLYGYVTNANGEVMKVAFLNEQDGNLKSCEEK